MTLQIYRRILPATSAKPTEGAAVTMAGITF
jgi:hypothetical protein